jgi:hypothetical protein
MSSQAISSIEVDLNRDSWVCVSGMSKQTGAFSFRPQAKELAHSEYKDEVCLRLLSSIDVR